MMGHRGADDESSGGIGLIVLVGTLVLAGGLVGIAVGAGTASAADHGTISPEVLDEDGEQDLVVYFGTEAGSDEPLPVEELKDRTATSQESLDQYAADTPGVTVERSLWLGNLAVVTVDHDRVDVRELATLEGVEHVGPNVEVSIDRTTATAGDRPAVPASDRPAAPDAVAPRYPSPAEVRPDRSTPASTGLLDASTTATADAAAVETTYGLDQINAPAVWEQYDTRGEGTTVAVLDTGVDPDHPDIDVGAFAEFDENGNVVGTDPYDSGTHGTHVSGTVAGGNASGKYIGVAPDAELHHGLVLPGGQGSFTQIFAGMQWAVENDADVISMSLGADGAYPANAIDPIRDAQSAGTMVIAASGNEGEGTSSFPGNAYDGTSVGASDENENIASFSSGETIVTEDAWGSDAPDDWPDEYVVPAVSAPGSAVESAVPGGDYELKWGTSMATPHVSGVIALLQSASAEDRSIAEIETALFETASKPDGGEDGRDTRYGHGIVDAEAAANTLVDDPEVGDYANDEGTVDLRGVRAAVADWRSGTIGTELLLDVLGAWQSGETVA